MTLPPFKPYSPIRVVEDLILTRLDYLCWSSNFLFPMLRDNLRVYVNENPPALWDLTLTTGTLDGTQTRPVEIDVVAGLAGTNPAPNAIHIYDNGVEVNTGQFFSTTEIDGPYGLKWVSGAERGHLFGQSWLWASGVLDSVGATSFRVDSPDDVANLVAKFETRPNSGLISFSDFIGNPVATKPASARQQSFAVNFKVATFFLNQTEDRGRYLDYKAFDQLQYLITDWVPTDDYGPAGLPSGWPTEFTVYPIEYQGTQRAANDNGILSVHSFAVQMIQNCSPMNG